MPITTDIEDGDTTATVKSAIEAILSAQGISAPSPDWADATDKLNQVLALNSEEDTLRAGQTGSYARERINAANAIPPWLVLELWGDETGNLELWGDETGELELWGTYK